MSRFLTRQKWWKKLQTWKELDTYSYQGCLFSVLRNPEQLPDSFADAVETLRRIDSGHIRIYVTPGWRLFPFLRPNSLDAVVAKSYGRFGNQILELACAHSLTKVVHAETLIPQEPYPFRPGAHELEDLEVRVVPGAIKRNSLTDLVLCFFRGLRPAIQIRGAMYLAWMENLGSTSPTPSRETYKRIGGIVDWPAGQVTLPDNHVVVHIRSGDVFSRPPHPTYGQPPLAFYQKCIKTQEWGKVWLVAEDNRNPVVDELLLWLERTGIPHEFHSKDFQADVALLVAAKNIIASRGTFVASIVAAVPHNPHVFFMEQQTLPVQIENVTEVEDTCGVYSSEVLADNWGMTGPQLKLMVTYDESCLSLNVAT